MLKLVVRKSLSFYNFICFFIIATLTMVVLFTCKVFAYSPENEDEVKEKLSRILSSGEFGDGQKPKSLIESLHERFMDFLKDLLERLNVAKKLDQVFGEGKVSPQAFLILKIVAIVMIIAVIILVIYIVTKRLARSKKMRREEDALLLNVLKDPHAVYKKAYEYYDNGDYNQALRFLYISILIRFNELNIIRINKAKTNKQYLAEIRDNSPDIYDVMNKFTQDFNRHWYGGRNADRATFTNWDNVYSTLVKGEVNKS